MGAMTHGRSVLGLRSRRQLTFAESAALLQVQAFLRVGGVLAATLAMVASTVGCGGGSAAPPPPAIVVTATAAANTVEAGGTVAITSTVTNDPANKGVTFAISPSGAGTLSNVTSTSVTYNAPKTPPASDLSVTITATSVSDGTKGASVSITVPAITVSVGQDTGSVEAGGVANLTATVNNDNTNKGVTWTLSPATGAGTLSNATSTSVTYTAPATVPPADVIVTITATSVTDPTKSGAATVDYAAISVSVGADTNTAAGGTVANLTATVNNDPTNQGVTWSLSPVTGEGTLSSATATTVTYDAPASAPVSDETVTVTATSISDPTKSASASITVPAIVVKVTPLSALIPLNASLQFTATVSNNPANQGTNWDVDQSGTSCVPGCGAFSPTSTANGTPSTYTAPASLPATPGVTPTATSISDGTKSATATVTLTAGSVELVPTAVDFGSVKTNSKRVQPINLTNTGSSALTITAITFSGMGVPAFSETDNCVPSVAAGASCVITVTFHPVKSGTFNVGMNIQDSSSDSPQVVGLTGKAFSSHEPNVAAALSDATVNEIPLPTGRNIVGTRVVRLVDATREDPYARDGSKRELLVRFWYPAAEGQVCRQAPYTSARVWSYFSRLVALPLARISTNSCADAVVADGGHPVVVFSHGYTATFTDYTFLFEDLASRGYVVASIDHTREATAVEFPDERFVASAVGSHLGGPLRAERADLDFALAVRLGDVKFVGDELARLNGESGGAFAGKLDLSKMALAGHSLGGWMAIESVSSASVFKVGVAIDASIPTGAAISTEKPMLLLGMGRELWSDDEKQVWSGLHGPRFALNLPGAEHRAPSDAVWLARYAINTGSLSPEQTIAMVREYVAAFLDANLREQEASPLLKGPSQRYRDVVVTTQKESLRSKN